MLAVTGRSQPIDAQTDGGQKQVFPPFHDPKQHTDHEENGELSSQHLPIRVVVARKRPIRRHEHREGEQCDGKTDEGWGAILLHGVLI